MAGNDAAENNAHRDRFLFYFLNKSLQLRLFDWRLFAIYRLEQANDLHVAPLGDVGQLLTGHFLLITL
jgi:hypothetical protein